MIAYSEADYLARLRRAAAMVRELEQKLDAAERGKTEPIAIIGMGCRFPGGVLGDPPGRRRRRAAPPAEPG